MKHAHSLSIVFGCLLGASVAAQPPARDSALYIALGAKPGITAIVDGMLNNIAHDLRIVRYFASVNIAHVRRGLVTKLCAVSGGPCDYTGSSMADAHRGLHITPAAFNALVEDLQAAMIELNVPLTARNRLLARLAKMRNDIVEPAD